MVSRPTGNIRRAAADSVAAGDEAKKLSWLRQILEWQQDMSDNKEFLNAI